MSTQTANCGGGLTATWNDAVSGPLTITYDGVGTGVMNDYTSGGAPWYSSRTLLTSLSLPDGITHIGNFAFYNCYGFTGSLVIPNSVTSIGNYAFNGCSGFTGSLTIGNSVTSIGKYAFYNCYGFTGSLVIPNSVTSIGNYAFLNCSGFNGTLTIPNSVTSIGNNAFSGCRGFTDVKFLGNQPTLGSNAFKLNTSSPAKTYDVYSNGWANTTTFPEYDCTKWNYIVLETSNAYVWNGSTWKKSSGKTSVYNGGWKS